MLTRTAATERVRRTSTSWRYYMIVHLYGCIMSPAVACRMMFWSEIGGLAQIERSSMDGSDRRVVISRGLNWPVSVTVDVLTDRLYWTDKKLGCIGSATLDGENIRVI